MFIRTFLSVGRHRSALSYIESLMQDCVEWKDALDSYRIEACWKLGSWEKLNHVIGNKYMASSSDQKTLANDSDTAFELIAKRSYDANLFNTGIGKLFCSVDCQNEKDFYETLRVLRVNQITPLSAISMETSGGSYQRGYEYVVNLQILQEIESCLSELLKLKTDTEKERYKNLISKNLESFIIDPWERRVETMQPSFKCLEPIYNVRVALLNFLSKQLNINVNKQLAKLWLRLAKIARKGNMFENAYQYMLNAQGQIMPLDTHNLEELLIEKSKWYWQREDKDSALFYLQKGLNELFNSDSSEVANNDLYSKVLLMYTKFGEENGSLDSETIRKNYLKVQKMCSKVEQSHFQLAQFTDRLGMDSFFIC
jgi:serine/threonine-protein kinase ATR